MIITYIDPSFLAWSCLAKPLSLVLVCDLDVCSGPLWLSSLLLPHTKECAHTLIELRFNLKPLKHYLGWGPGKYVG